MELSKDEIIRMAEKACAPHQILNTDLVFLERFFNLAFAAGAAHERNRHAWTQEHWTQYEHAIAAAERERIAASIDVEEYHRGSWFAREIRSMK